MNDDARSQPTDDSDFLSSLVARAFVVVRSKKDDDALVRLQSDPILHGLQTMVGVNATLHVPSSSSALVLDQPTCLIFHYNDVAAIETIRGLQRKAAKPLIVCLGSDMYSFARYLDVHDIVDAYIMPTALHRKILASAVYKPVYVLEEAVDPNAVLAGQDRNSVFPTKSGTRALWFGYSESFYKSMTPLIPVIMQAVADHHLDEFSVIVDQEGFEAENNNRFRITTIPYDNATFRSHADRFDYAVLSHFSFDLKLNTYIKSPNKLVTALIAGLIPIVSDTPNYRAILERHGLQKFLFSSPQDLWHMLRNLDPVADSDIILRSGVISSLLDAGSARTVAAKFLHLMRHHEQTGDDAVTSMPLISYVEPPKRVIFRDHLSDLLPSAMRAFESRLRRLRR